MKRSSMRRRITLRRLGDGLDDWRLVMTGYAVECQTVVEAGHTTVLRPKSFEELVELFADDAFSEPSDRVTLTLGGRRLSMASHVAGTLRDVCEDMIFDVADYTLAVADRNDVNPHTES